jgi:hypothetical protein
MLIPFPSPPAQSVAYWDGKCDFAVAPKAKISDNSQEYQYFLQLLPVQIKLKLVSGKYKHCLTLCDNLQHAVSTRQ